MEGCHAAAKAAEKKAAADAKQAAKWERFAKLPVQLEKWLTKEIHSWADMITDEGLAKAKQQCEMMASKFDQDWYIKRSETNIEKLDVPREDLHDVSTNKDTTFFSYSILPFFGST